MKKRDKRNKYKEEELNQETEALLEEQQKKQEEYGELEMEKSPVVKLEEELSAWKDKYLRLQAEFDNFRKRNIKEKADIIKGASGEVIGKLLSVLDDFERAIEVNDSKEEDDVEAIKEGFKLIYQKLKNILESQGLKPMNASGEDFNPEFHQAITQIEAGEENRGKVVDEVEKGYYLNDKILRFAKAVVGK